MSVLVQAEDVPLEILVGVDHCEDNTGEIARRLAKAHPNHIRCFNHERNIGATQNIQFLIRSSQGEYIAHLDGDDYWLPGKLREQVEVLDHNPEVPVVYSNAMVVDDKGLPMGIFNNILPERFDINELLKYGNFLNHSSILYRANLRHTIVDANGPLLDYWTHLRLTSHGALAYINRPLVVYRRASSSSMVSNNNEFVREMYWESLMSVSIDEVNRCDLGRGMAEFLRSVIYRSFKTKKWYLIKKWWPKVFKAAPISNIEMVWWLLFAIVRTANWEILGLFCMYLGRSRLRVYYRR